LMTACIVKTTACGSRHLTCINNCWLFMGSWHALFLSLLVFHLKMNLHLFNDCLYCWNRHCCIRHLTYINNCWPFMWSWHIHCLCICWLFTGRWTVACLHSRDRCYWF
jgi:hypothetical protein